MARAFALTDSQLPSPGALPRVEDLVPALDARFLLLEQGTVVALDRDRADFLALAHGVDDDAILAGDDLAEHRVLAVEPRRRHVRDEELAAVRVRAGVRHRQDACLVVLERGHDLVLEAVAGAAAATSF